MGCTLEQLGQHMSAQEFGLHLAIEHEEPLAPALATAFASVLAAAANGQLKTPQGRLWAASDFLPDTWEPRAADAPAAPPPAPITAQSILAAARAAGMPT